MQKVKYLLTLLALALLLGAGLGTFIQWKSAKVPDKNLQVKTDPRWAMVSFAQEIEEAWSSGLWPKEIQQCPQMHDLLAYLEKRGLNSQRWLRCEPQALRCWLQYLQDHPKDWKANPEETMSLTAVPLNGELAPLFFHENPKVERASKEIFFQLQHRASQSSLVFSLQDTCNDSLLSMGLRPYGSAPQGGMDYLWDNRENQIYLDRFPVSRGEFYEWAKSEDARPPRGIEYFEVEGRASLEQQKKYCEAQGKTLMQAHVYDGASFFPAQIESAYIAIIPRGPYPQGRRRSASYLGRVLDEKIVEVDLGQLCREIRTKECADLDSIHLAREESAPSTSGMFQVLGGAFESVRNPLHPKRNLKLSSAEFGFSSPVHILGARGFWSGQGWTGDEFELGTDHELSSRDEYLVGFRCQGGRRF